MAKSRSLLRAAIVAVLLGSIGCNLILYRLATTYYVQAKTTAIFPSQKERYATLNRELANKTKTRVILFGDSRIQRWEQLPGLAGAELINRGIDGQTTAQMRLRFDSDVLSLAPDIVVLQMGINDLVGIGVMPEREREISGECAENLRYFVDQLVARQVRVILLTIIPADRPGIVRSAVWSDRIDVEVERLNAYWLRLRPSSLLSVVDTRAALENAEHRPFPGVYVDALHLSAEGYARLNRAIEPLLKR